MADFFARLPGFLGDHWMLSSLWLALFFLLLAYVNAKAGVSFSPQQATLLLNRDGGVMLDVREHKDFERGHIAGAINIPLAKLPERAVELDKKKEQRIIVVCNMGHSAADAVKLLQARGFTQVNRMAGGMTEW
ncbi:MAG: rhodanese-like domain-containing protein, partial [Pseudomonadales bacterium]|nr:rhodanese-like domain-containing protein [Pseudomonadales bacterium]